MSGYRLGISCCFCGGGLEIDEASRTTRCRHCGSILRIARAGGIRSYYVDDQTVKREVKFLIDRHLKDSGEPLVSRWGEILRVYLPFWRMTAVAFSTIERATGAYSEYAELQQESVEAESRTEVKIALKDVSFCANDTFAWGIESLGVRTQVLTLKPLDSEFNSSNHLVPLTVDFEAAKGRLHSTIASIATAGSSAGSSIDVTTTTPEGTLIYFPLWVVEFTNGTGEHVAQFDPVASRVSSVADGRLEMPDRAGDTPSGCDVLQVVPHRCPECGHDMPESEKSVTYYCTNCRRLFGEVGLEYRQLELKIPSGLDQHCRLLPFWVFDIRDSVWPQKAELLHALSLIGFSREKFYVPAFDIGNPSRLLRLVSHYNKADHSLTFEQLHTGDYCFADVTLAPEGAADLIIPLTVATKTMKGYKSHEAYVSGGIDAAPPELIWMPYALDTYFWRDQITGAVIEKAAVKI
jgi:hypothetical protein